LAITAMATVMSAGLLVTPLRAHSDSASVPTPVPAVRTVDVPADAAAARRTCGAEPTTAAGWQRLWDAQSGAWAGGDGASSTRLPDGRLLWLFGDTFVGSVDASGHRDPRTRLVRNSVVVTDGTCVDVVSTRTDAFPGRSGSWLWPTHAVVVAAGRPGTPSRLVVFAQRVVRAGIGTWAFRRTGTAVTSLEVPWRGTPVVGAVRDLPASQILWGAAVVTQGPTTWVYGTQAVDQPLVFGRELLLARAPTATVEDPSTWVYRTATGWTSHASDAAVVRPASDGVSTVPSAARVGTSYVIVTKPDEFLGADVDALTAPHPWGPWTDHRLFRAASRADEPRYSPCLVATGRSSVVVVSRTSTSIALLGRDAWRARPTFTDVRLPA
jgi:hypothetical protein